MKWFLAFCAMFVCLLTSAQTNTIIVPVADYTGTSYGTNTTVTLTLISPNPRTVGTLLIRQDPISQVCGTNGSAYFTNVIWGKYRCEVGAKQPNVTPFTFYVGTNTLGTVYIASLITNSAALPPNPATNYYTAAQVDALILRAGMTSVATTNTPTFAFTGDGTPTNPLAGTVLGGVSANAVTNYDTRQLTLTNSLNQFGGQYIALLDGAVPAWKEGLVMYDPVQHTLAFYNDSSNMLVNVSAEMPFKTTNRSGQNITNGQVVYLQGSIGQLPKCWLAIATNEVKASVFGMATEDIPVNANGYVTVWGYVNDIDTSAFSEGDDLYLSPTTLGGLTTNAPVAPNYMVRVGQCVYSHSQHGRILIQVVPQWVGWNSVIGKPNVVTNGQTNVTLAGSFTATGGNVVTNGQSTLGLTNASGSPEIYMFDGTADEVGRFWFDGAFNVDKTVNALLFSGNGGGLTNVTAANSAFANTSYALNTGNLTVSGDTISWTEYGNQSIAGTAFGGIKLSATGGSQDAGVYLGGGVYGNGLGLTNLQSTNISGILPMGTLTTLPVVTNGFLTTDGTNRSYSKNAQYLTNVQDSALSTNIARLNQNSVWTSNGVATATIGTNGFAAFSQVVTSSVANGSTALRLTSGSFIQYGSGNDCRLRLNGANTAEYQTLEITRFNGKSGISVSTLPGVNGDDSSIVSPSAGNWIIGGASGSGTPTYTGSITTSNILLSGTATATNGVLFEPRALAPTLAQIGTTNKVDFWGSNDIPQSVYATSYAPNSNRLDVLVTSLQPRWIDAPGQIIPLAVGSGALTIADMGDGIFGYQFDRIFGANAYGTQKLPFNSEAPHNLYATNAYYLLSNTNLYIEPHFHGRPLTAPTAPNTNISFQVVWKACTPSLNPSQTFTNTVTYGLIAGSTNEMLIEFSHTTYATNQPTIATVWPATITVISSGSNPYMEQAGSAFVIRQPSFHVPISSFQGSTTDSTQ